MKLKKYICQILVGIISIALLAPVNTFAGSLTDFSHTANTWVAGASNAEHTFTFTTETQVPANGYIFLDTAGIDFDYASIDASTLQVNGGFITITGFSFVGTSIRVGINQVITAGATVILKLVSDSGSLNQTAGEHSFTTFRTQTNDSVAIDTVSAPSFTIFPGGVPGVVYPDAGIGTPPAPDTRSVPSLETTNLDPGTLVAPVERDEEEPFEPVSKEENLHFSGYIHIKKENNSDDVTKLQKFLNTFEGEKLDIDGTYKISDLEAVQRFQLKYTEFILAPWGIKNPTGYVYKTTLKMIHTILDAQ